MVDPVFKAPPPINPPEMPEAPEVAKQGQNEQANTTTEQVAPAVDSTLTNQVNTPETATEGQPDSKKQQVLDRLNELKDRMVQYFWYSMMGLFLLGIFFGCSMSGSDSAPQQTQSVSGISARVISNGDKKTRLGICGSVPASQSCLFYVLNSSSYDRVAEDFFEQVSRITTRSVFNIRLDNPLYQKQPIKPGYFAEIIIPSMN